MNLLLPVSTKLNLGGAFKGAAILLGCFFVIGLLLPSPHRIGHGPLNDPKMQTRKMLKDIEVAVGHFRTEYNAFPISWKSEDRDVSLRSRGDCLAALIGKNKSLNPEEIAFVDLPFAKEGRSGLIREANEWRLVDVWGEMYYILLDTNYDNRVDNPERQGMSPPSPAFLAASSVIYSSGPDRDPGTWSDNITSWPREGFSIVEKSSGPERGLGGYVRD